MPTKIVINHPGASVVSFVNPPLNSKNTKVSHIKGYAQVAELTSGSEQTVHIKKFPVTRAITLLVYPDR